MGYNRESAERLGATVTVDPFNQDLETIAKAVTDELGFNAALDLKPLISHVDPLEQINQAFRDQRAGKVMRALIQP